VFEKLLWHWSEILTSLSCLMCQIKVFSERLHGNVPDLLFRVSFLFGTQEEKEKKFDYPIPLPIKQNPRLFEYLCIHFLLTRPLPER
jgi:hypothetical protein